MREVQGTGGALFVQQLKAAGVEYIFFNPSTGDFPIFDALVDEPSIQLIKGVQEGAVVAMADGYARASGKTGVVIVANIGLPNAMTQMVNSWKDQIPILVAVASVEHDALGRDLTQETDHGEVMTQPITKWHWSAKTTAGIPETTRRGMKFASTAPVRPGVPVAADQRAARAGQGRDLGPGQVRRADAHPSRQGRRREDRARAHRGAQSAHQRRRRDRLVPRREGAAQARRIAWPAGRRAVALARLLVAAVPDPASALCRAAAARHALSGQARCAAQPRQQIRRARLPGHEADLDPSRSGEPCPQRAGRSRHGRRSAARDRRHHRGGSQHRTGGEDQGDRGRAPCPHRRLHQGDARVPHGRSSRRTPTARR